MSSDSLAKLSINSIYINTTSFNVIRLHVENRGENDVAFVEIMSRFLCSSDVHFCVDYDDVLSVPATSTLCKS